MALSGSAGSAPASPGLFARNATGLVRAVTPLSSFLVNFIPGTPVQALGYGLFFAFALFPGGNFLIAGLLVIPLTLSYAYSFGLLTSMIPRSGGDYIFVGRVLNPWLGLISSFCMTLSNVLSVAFFGIVVVQLGLSPGLIGIGLVEHNQTLIDWGNTIAVNIGWKWVFGTGLFIAGALIHAWGWKWTARLQAILLSIVMLSVLLAVGIALFTSHASFMANFNQFAGSYTHQPSTYDEIIGNATKAGVDVNPGFSFGNTIPLIGIFASFGIYSYFSSFLGGELRQARSIKTANIMAIAGVAPILIILVCAAIFLNTFGTEFMTAANAAGTMPAEIATAPTYFFLVAASTGNVWVAVLLLVGYLLFWPLITYMGFIQPVRMIFAYGFDGILPKVVTNLSRSRAPYVALIITVLLAEAMFAWAVNSPSIFTVIVYATLIQLVSMALVGLAALVVPWRRPEFYRAGSTTRTVLGIPLVSIAGAGAILSAVFVWVLYFHYAQFGLSDLRGFFTWVIGTVAAAVIFYFVVKFVRARQGVDLNRVYAEIPPE